MKFYPAWPLFVLIPAVALFLYLTFLVVRASFGRHSRWALIRGFTIAHLSMAFVSILGAYLVWHGYQEADQMRMFLIFSAFAFLLLISQVLFLLFVLPALLFRLVFPRGPVGQWAGASFRFLAVLVVAVFELLFVYSAIWGRRRFVFTHHDIVSPYIPADSKPVTIVQFTDMHLGSWFACDSARLAAAFDSVMSYNPDLIVFTGDMVNNFADEMLPWKPLLSDLKARSGKYSVTGNHDYGGYSHWNTEADSAANFLQLLEHESDCGMTVLNNSFRVFPFEGYNLVGAGIENWGKPPFPAKGRLPVVPFDSLSPCFVLLLSHDPSFWDMALPEAFRADLTLSGHTHAAQLQFGRWSPVQYVYPRWYGFYKRSRQLLYVNRGFGYLGAPLRFGAWPEIAVFTLRGER